jgi:hypothetical protein
MSTGIDKPGRLPMMLSAFVYPGTGQFMQRRRVAGLVYAILFSVFLVVLIFNVFRPLIHNLVTVLNWAAETGDEPLQRITMAGVLAPFGLGLAVYVANLFDVAWANRKMSARPPPLT